MVAFGLMKNVCLLGNAKKMSTKKCHSKAEVATLILKNEKVEKLNAFYLYHKEIIDEFWRLQEEVSKAKLDCITATLNTIQEKFPPKNNL
jgi:hypothetical protein